MTQPTNWRAARYTRVKHAKRHPRCSDRGIKARARSHVFGVQRTARPTELRVPAKSRTVGRARHSVRADSLDAANPTCVWDADTIVCVTIPAVAAA